MNTKWMLALPAVIWIVVAAAWAQAAVNVEVVAATVERRTFDPKNPPKDLPKLAPNEAAVTRSNFMVDTRIAADAIKREPVGGQFRSTLRVQAVRMRLTLSIEIWLPNDAVPKLVNHEEGHRMLAEHYYKDAEQVARRHAEALVGQNLSGTGPDYQAAGDSALKQAAEVLGQKYLGDIDVPCGRAQEIYDQITRHGTNPVKESKAIEEAIQRVRDEEKP